MGIGTLAVSAIDGTWDGIGGLRDSVFCRLASGRWAASVGVGTLAASVIGGVSDDVGGLRDNVFLAIGVGALEGVGERRDAGGVGDWRDLGRG